MIKNNCLMCGKYCFNKNRSAKYCKDCAAKTQDIRSRINTVTNLMRRKYPDFEIKINIKVSKKDYLDKEPIKSKLDDCKDCGIMSYRDCDECLRNTVKILELKLSQIHNKEQDKNEM